MAMYSRVRCSRAGALALLALCALLAPRPAAAQAPYPSCSRCTSASSSEARCWSDTSFVLSSCGEEGLCANKACAGPGETYGAAITRYIQNKHLTGCASSYTTVKGFPARSCPAAVVVFNPARKCAYGISGSTANRVNEIGKLWGRSAVVNGVSYDVAFELGAPAGEVHMLKNAGGGDVSSYQLFDRGGITITPSWLPGFPATARAVWVGGKTERAMTELGKRWKAGPFILAGDQYAAAQGGYAATGYHDRTRPTTLFSAGGAAAKVGGTTDVSAAIWTRWNERGGFDGPDALSYPVGEETNGAQRFERGILAADGSATPTAHLLGEAGSPEADALLALWQEAGSSVPRTAAGDATFVPENGGGYQVDNDMSGAARASFVAKSGADAAVVVAGDSAAYWRDSGAAAGFLQWPVENASGIPGGGLVQKFEGGNVYQQPGGRAFAVPGGASPILDAYLAVGGPSGALGFPIEDAPLPGGGATALKQRFQHGLITQVSNTVALPEVYDGVDPPTDFTITSVTDHSVTLRWKDSGSPYTTIHRQREGGQYERIATLTLPEGFTTFTDDAATAPPGPLSGGFNCYIVRAADNPDGFCTAGYTCEQTRLECPYVPVAGEAPVSRVQLRVKVGSEPSSGTSGSVRIRLNGFNGSWIDTPRRDFLPGSDEVFDLQTDAIHIASDIREITIAVPGDDDLCVDELELFLNCGVVNNCVPITRAFKKVFGPTTCARAVHSDRPPNQNPRLVSVPYPELRAPNAFGTWPEPFEIRQVLLRLESVASLADAAMGHQFHGQSHNPRFKDGTPTVHTFVDEATLHIRQTVLVDCGFWCGYGTTTAAIFYDLVLVPTPTGTTLDVQNADVDSDTDSILELFGLAWSQLYLPAIETIVKGRILAQLQSAAGNDLGTPPPGKFFCFTSTALALCP
jgi:hypothetical protein